MVNIDKGFTEIFRTKYKRKKERKKERILKENYGDFNFQPNASYTNIHIQRNHTLQYGNMSKERRKTKQLFQS